jgi:hypothetical protein
MREEFIEKEFKGEAFDLLRHMIVILRKYAGQGLDLSLRR